MEDLDPPREQTGAAESILDTLEAHGLRWDGGVLFQSRRLDAYTHLLGTLAAGQLTYLCHCTRQDIRSMGGHGDERCRKARAKSYEGAAVRLKVSDLPRPYAHCDADIMFDDLFQGRQRQRLDTDVGDFIIRRKDGLFAYQLAVVADDIAQGVTHVIRGSDLLHSTARQLFLFRLLGATPPEFGHIPVITNLQGQKLSKQHGAPPIDNTRAASNLMRALQSLRHFPPPPLRRAPPRDLLEWATANWRRDNLPRGLSIADPTESGRR